jgi:hypothetical protein
MIQVQYLAKTRLNERRDHGDLKVDIHHNETLLTLSGVSQVGKIDLTEVGLS